MVLWLNKVLLKRCADDLWDWVAIISMSRILAAGKPNKATSSCCIMSVWRSSARLHIWLVRQIFCIASVETKAVMSGEMAIQRSIRGKMLMPDDIRIERRERITIPQVTNGTDLSSPMGRLILNSIMSLT